MEQVVPDLTLPAQEDSIIYIFMVSYSQGEGRACNTETGASTRARAGERPETNGEKDES